MIINDLLSQLENSTSPVTKILQKGENFKVIAMAFKKEMILKEHKTAIPAKLLVLDGSVVFKEASKSVVMNKYDEMEIPVNELHSVEALADSVCLLIQG